MDALIRSPRIAAQRLKLGAPPAQEFEASKRLQLPTAAELDVDAFRREAEERVRAEMRCALDAERETARQQGFDEGLRQGREAAAGAARQHAADRQKAIDEALAATRAGLDAAIESVLERAADIACIAVARIAGAKAVSREFVLGQVESVLRHVATEGPITVRLHPAQAAVLKLGAAEAAMPSGRGLSVIADAALDVGSCLVDGVFGRLDASLPTQLRKLREVLDACAQERGA